MGLLPQNVAGSETQEESIYSSACNMGNKQEGLEAAVQQENCCHRGDAVGRAGLCVRECFGCLELNDGGSGEEFMDENQGVTLPVGV